MATSMDLFGFPSLPAGTASEVQPGRSPTEDADALKAWAKTLSVAMPSMPAGSDADMLLAQAMAQKLATRKLSSVKDLVRSRGVPRAARHAVWLALSGGMALKTQMADGYFNRLASSSGDVPEATLTAIDADTRMVGISWRPHKLFTLAKTTEALTKILTALMQHAPQLGYNRQLCHMAAFVIVVYGGPAHQEAVFWTLAAILTDKLAVPTSENATSGAATPVAAAAGSSTGAGGSWAAAARVQQAVLERLIARKLPRLAAHLSSMRCELGPSTQPWLLSLFVSVLPPEVLVRVWDCALCEGPKVVLRVALALLKVYEHTLSACTLPDFMRKMLELRASRTTGTDQLLAVAFKGLGSLPGTLVASIRTEVLRAGLPPLARRAPSPPDTPPSVSGGGAAGSKPAAAPASAAGAAGMLQPQALGSSGAGGRLVAGLVGRTSPPELRGSAAAVATAPGREASGANSDDNATAGGSSSPARAGISTSLAAAMGPPVPLALPTSSSTGIRSSVPNVGPSRSGRGGLRRIESARHAPAAASSSAAAAAVAAAPHHGHSRSTGVPLRSALRHSSSERRDKRVVSSSGTHQTPAESVAAAALALPGTASHIAMAAAVAAAGVESVAVDSGAPVAVAPQFVGAVASGCEAQAAAEQAAAGAVAAGGAGDRMGDPMGDRMGGFLRRALTAGGAELSAH